MSQKTNKIIVLVSLSIVIGILIWIISASKKEKPFLPATTPSLNLSTYEGKSHFLFQECELPENSMMSICKYSPLEKAFPITENKEIIRNDEKITMRVVHFGDLDIFKINLRPIILEEEYKDISEKLPDKFQLCFELSPFLEKIKVFPEEIFAINSTKTFCTKSLNKSNLPQFGFSGYIPYPEQENQEISITLYLVPQGLALNTSASLNANSSKLIYLVSLIPAIIEK